MCSLAGRLITFASIWSGLIIHGDIRGSFKLTGRRVSPEEIMSNPRIPYQMSSDRKRLAAAAGRASR